MKRPDGKLVWITQEQRDSLAGWAIRGDGTEGELHDEHPCAIIDAYDAAAADPAEAVAAKLNEIDLDPAFRDQPWYVVAPHVLRALGVPDANQEQA